MPRPLGYPADRRDSCRLLIIKHLLSSYGVFLLYLDFEVLRGNSSMV